MGVSISISNYPNAEAMQKGLDLAQKTGIRMISSCPELFSDVEITVKRFMGHPALAGYFLKDEPVRKDFQGLGMQARKIEAIDTEHFCFVNLFAVIHATNTQALGTSSYVEYLNTFAKEVPSKILSFDFYPILSRGVHERWYEGLELFSSETKKLNKPFWAFTLASSYNQLHPVPTSAALRLQIYTNLAYGAQGIEYWSYWMSSGLRSAPIGADGKRTATYDKIREVNSEIQKLAWVFMGSKLLSVGHTGTVIPRGTARLTKLPSAIKLFEAEEPGVQVSLLENGENTFFVVLNRDMEKTASITILGDETLRRVLKDGTLANAAAYPPGLDIEPASVAVYMFPTRK